MTKNGKCDTEIRKYIRIAKYTLQKLKRVLIDRKISLEKGAVSSHI